MAKKVFTATQIAYIKKNRLRISGAQMSRNLGFKRNAVGQWMRYNGLRAPKKLQLKFRLDAINKIKNYPRPEDPIIKKNYLTVNINQLSAMVSRSDQFVLTSLKRQGLIIPKKIIKQRIQDARIKKGNIPPNKGKKQKDYMSKAQIKKTMATRFKKGHLPHNSIGIKDGDIRIRRTSVSKGQRPYKYIRLSLGKWKPLHVYNWEKKNGPVPKNKIVVFKNGDSLNCKINNLKLITRQEHGENTRNTDGYIAMTMSHGTGTRGSYNKELYNKILTNKPLINLKRKQLQLKRAINESSLQIS